MTNLKTRESRLVNQSIFAWRFADGKGELTSLDQSQNGQYP